MTIPVYCSALACSQFTGRLYTDNEAYNRFNSLNAIGHARGLKLISGVACAVGHVRDRSSAIFYTDLFALFK